MARIGQFAHLTATAGFVTGGLIFATRPGHSPTAIFGPDRMAGPLLPTPGQIDQLSAAAIPQLYLHPGNPVMWALLISVWLLLWLDAIGQWIDPSETPGAPRVWPLLCLALLSATAWPWLFDGHPALLALGASVTAGAAILAARRAAGSQRPAIGFFAGWTTAILSAALAGFVAAQFGLPMQAVSAMAILPGAALGIATQIWIGPSIGYSAALIWAFCGLAITTMGSDPIIALAAIFGIAAMATALVRAAS